MKKSKQLTGIARGGGGHRGNCPAAAGYAQSIMSLNLSDRFNPDSVGLKRYVKLESMLLAGRIELTDAELVRSYTELKYVNLKTQLT